jgi:hypothetical protein
MSKPCKKCGAKERNARGDCKACKREYNRKWAIENSEKKSESNRQWREANSDKAREYNRQWTKENREKKREAGKAWEQSNRQERKEYFRQYQKDNAEARRVSRNVRRARKVGNGGSFTPQEWAQLCKQYGNRCCYPGCERTDLHADHVIPLAKGGTSDISNIQPLCAYHNLSKGTKATDYRTKPGLIAWIQRKLF